MTTPDLSTQRGGDDEYFRGDGAANTRSDSVGRGVPNTMDVLSAVINARFALEYWMRETAVNARGKRWAEHGRKRSCLECETLQWIEGHLRAELDTPPALEERRG